MIDVLDPKQLAEEAQKAYRKGQFWESAEIFRAAEVSFEKRGDINSAAEMANNRSVALLQLGEATLAYKAVTGTDIIFERAGDIKRQALALGNQAAALEKLGQLEEAGESYRKSATIFKQLGEDECYATTMQAISAIYLRTGRPLQSLAAMQAGLDKVDHPNMKQRILKRILNIPIQLINR